MGEIKTPHAGGRPTDYSEEVLIKAREYLESCQDEESLDKSKLVRVKLPSIEGLAFHLGISRETIYQWEKDEDKKEFSDIIGDLRAKQGESLINKGLSGDYNSTIAKVLLTKHGYSDKQEIDHTTKGEKLPAADRVGVDLEELAMRTAEELKKLST